MNNKTGDTTDNKTGHKRFSKRTVRMAVSALTLGLMASLVPLATSQATAQVPEGELTPGEVLNNGRPSLHECILLLNELGGFHGVIFGWGSLDTPDRLPPDGDDEYGRDPVFATGPLNEYRELGCAGIPGFPTL